MTIQNISRKLASNVSYIIIAFSILAFFTLPYFFGQILTVPLC